MHWPSACEFHNLQATLLLCWMGPVGRDGRDEAVQLVPLLLQLLDQALDRAFAETLRFATLEQFDEKNYNWWFGNFDTGADPIKLFFRSNSTLC